MNKLTIIGNLTKAPELRTTQSGSTVCSFTVAVNRRRTQNNQQPEADYFHVSAWNKLGETCSKFLDKGKKVCIVGSVSVRTYEGSDGNTRAQLDVFAQDVEFLSPRNDGTSADESVPSEHVPAQNYQQDNAGFTPVDTEDELPF